MKKGLALNSAGPFSIKKNDYIWSVFRKDISLPLNFKYNYKLKNYN